LDYCPGCSLSYSQRAQALWAEFVNAATEINPELLAPQEQFKQPEGIVSRSYCAVSGMLPSELCEKAGLVKSDIYNAKYVPTETDDSLISSGSWLAFNPEWLKRNGYDNLSDLSILYPRTNRQLWEKIGSSKGKNEKEEIKEEKKEDKKEDKKENDKENSKKPDDGKESEDEDEEDDNNNEDDSNKNEDSEENTDNDDGD